MVLECNIWPPTNSSFTDAIEFVCSGPCLCENSIPCIFIFVVFNFQISLFLQDLKYRAMLVIRNIAPMRKSSNKSVFYKTTCAFLNPVNKKCGVAM